jgi:predicted 3-demethylubiquinone-9 3-methyltransferase (glyoxalase superfamily)
MTTTNIENASDDNTQAIAVKSSQNITPFLWFDGRVEEAVHFYTSVFADSEILNISHLPGETPGVKGRAQTAAFRLNGLEFFILDGGPMFKPSPGVSFFVKCETQAEVDHYWEKLAEGGKHSQCGWLDDKFGITWQIVPNALGRLMSSPNPVKARNVIQAMMKMTKLDIAGLQAAHDKE